ncbi:MAG: YfbM family protein, partial [Phycisphaerales bacterium JB063]
WHAIHFLLNGEVYGGDPPLCNAVLGGEPIGEDAGYGPARYLTPEQVADVAATLKSISRESLLAKFDAAALTENSIYPSIWDEGEEALDYIGQYYEETQRFFADASKHGYAALTYIN